MTADIESVRNYKKVSYFTLIVLFLLIGVGGLVRVTGSGMGCPDWPKCFGLWVPPTCECQLPNNYHEIYKNHGYPLGTNFDKVKTWVEYLNRLLGVLAGFFVIITVFYAYRIRSLNRSIFYAALLCFILVMLEGALGALVVRLNLQQGSVTIHYFMAMMLVCSLLYSIAARIKTEFKTPLIIHKTQWYSILLALTATSIQLVSGSVLRSITETIQGVSAYEWLAQNEAEFMIHRLHALVVVASIYFLWTQFRKYKFFSTALLTIWICLILQVLTGIIINYYDFPKTAQTLHIVLPTILFCSQFFIFVILFIKTETLVVSN